MNVRKILLVEDDFHTRFMMSEMLEELEYSFEIANDGSECLDMLEKNPKKYDAILMDIHMPRVSGIEALTEIRSKETDPPRGIYVVALTADTSWHNPQKVQNVGFDNLLTKPVEIAKIRQVLS